MTSQAALLGSSVHDAAQRAADILAVLLPRAGPRNRRLPPGSAAERAAVIEVLRAQLERSLTQRVQPSSSSAGPVISSPARDAAVPPRYFHSARHGV